ncbi:MAG: hypothetical protein LUQ59_00800, partial [Methanothrix sp.]|nr:hypothetical protein [Methanothrix sp.]
MKLGDYARHVTKEAEVRGEATYRYRANDPLIKPFAEFDRQKASLRALQESTVGLCWLDAKGKAIPYDVGAFARVQDEILRLQSAIDHNANVLDELEDMVRVIGLSEDKFSLGRLHGEKSRIQESIEQIRAYPDKTLAHKWRAVVEVGGDREMYEALPEVRAARQRAVEQIEPLKA